MKRVLVAGIVRMALIYRTNSRTRKSFPWRPSNLSNLIPVRFNPGVITLILENALAIVCACLPTYGPFLSMKTVNSKAWVLQILFKIRRKPGMSSRTHNTIDQTRVDLAQDIGPYTHLEDELSPSQVKSNSSRITSVTSRRGVEEGYDLDSFRGCGFAEVA